MSEQSWKNLLPGEQSWKNLLAEGEEMHQLRLTIAAQSEQTAKYLKKGSLMRFRVGAWKLKNEIQSQYGRLVYTALEFSWPAILVAFAFGGILGLIGGLSAHH